MRCYEHGGVFLLDEIDACDSNTLLAINLAIANGYCNVPNRHGNPVAHRHPNFIVIATANTLGRGATRSYAGRNQLDEASLELAAALYGAAVTKVVSVSSCEVAEAAKILENTYRAVNIALANELKKLFAAIGLDVWEVIAAAATKPFGFQSSCLMTGQSSPLPFRGEGR